MYRRCVCSCPLLVAFGSFTLPPSLLRPRHLLLPSWPRRGARPESAAICRPTAATATWSLACPAYHLLLPPSWPRRGTRPGRGAAPRVAARVPVESAAICRPAAATTANIPQDSSAGGALVMWTTSTLASSRKTSRCCRWRTERPTSREASSLAALASAHLSSGGGKSRVAHPPLSERHGAEAMIASVCRRVGRLIMASGGTG